MAFDSPTTERDRGSRRGGGGWELRSSAASAYVCSIARRELSSSPKKGDASTNRSSRISPASRKPPSRRQARPRRCGVGFGSMSIPFSPASSSPRASVNSWQPIQSCRWRFWAGPACDLIADGFDVTVRFGEALAFFRASAQRYHNRDMTSKKSAENPRPLTKERSNIPAIGQLGEPSGRVIWQR
jgi:hypothetical protein